MTTFLSDALELAASQPVLPLEPRGKRPVTGLGLRHATQDAETIEQWAHRWPDANVGMRCDHLAVIDVDGDAGERSLDRLQGRLGCLPASRAVKTGKGRHLFYVAEVAGNSTRPLGSPAGIDLRAGCRGYVVVPSSVHASGHLYRWIDDRPPVALPDGWLRTLGSRSRPSQPLAAVQVFDLGRETAYGRAALERELERLFRAAPGARNETLNRVVFRLAQLVAGDQLPLARVEVEALEVATAIGLDQAEAAATIRSAVRGGLRSPRKPSPSRAHARVRESSEVSKGNSGDSTFSTNGEVVSLSPLPALAGEKVEKVEIHSAHASAKTGLDILDECRPRRRNGGLRFTLCHKGGRNDCVSLCPDCFYAEHRLPEHVVHATLEWWRR